MPVLSVFIENNDVELVDYYTTKNQQHACDTGFDLICAETVTIEPKTTYKVSLGIKTEMKDGDNNVGWMLFPRSSITNTPLILHNSIGLIDPSYRGVIKAPFRNMSLNPYTIEKGTRLVQAVTFNGAPINVQVVDTLSATARGEGGFGSTGK